MTKKITSFTMTEASICRKGANDGATSYLMKSEDVKKADRVDLVSSNNMNHAHPIKVLIENGRLDFITYYANMPDGEYGIYHDHQMLKDTPNSRFILIENEGHTHEITFSEIDSFLREVRIAKSELLNGSTFEELINNVTFHGKEVLEMSENVKKSLGDETKTGNEAVAVEDTAKELELLKAVADLTPDQFAHYKAMEKAEEKAAFINKSADEKDAEVKKALDEAEAVKKANEDVLYTATDGTKVTKADGELVAKAMKDADEANAKLAKAEFDARVNENFGNTAFSDAHKEALQKSVDAMTDDKEKESFVKSVLAGTGEAGKQSTSVAKASNDDDAKDFVAKAVKDLQDNNPGLTEFDARNAVFKSKDFADFMSKKTA